MDDKMLDRGNEGGIFQLKSQKTIPILTGIIFLGLLGIALYKMFYESRTYSDVVISQHVIELAKIFKRIDDKCKIIDFDYQKNPINFLNVVKFVSSEIGPMNLTYPKNWEGPYVKDNYNVQKREYQIVKTKKGYFITPGDGVRLSSGKIVGKDIILDEDADISQMMMHGGDLNFKGRALAAPLPIGVNAFGKVILRNIFRVDDGLVLEQCDRLNVAEVKSEN